MNQSTFESVSRVLLAIAIAALAGVLALGGARDASAQTRTAQCDGYVTKKDFVATMDSMLGSGRTDFLVASGWLCGW
jgi:hypothetical protein